MNQILRLPLRQILIVFLLFIAENVFAENQQTAFLNINNGGEDAVSDLLNILDKETEIATKTKMNVDFVPGMVTVLHGKDMITRGARNLYEALAFVPGVELSMGGDGLPQLLIRGIGKTFASGKAKFLVNGIPLNSALSAATTAFSIPVEQIERIEVIRGPGSTVYGEYALAGVINVITRTQETGGFIRYGSFNTVTIGGALAYADSQRDLSFSLNLSGTSSEGAQVHAGPDKLVGTPWQKLETGEPRNTNEEERNRSVFFDLGYKGYVFKGQHVQQRFGDHFGFNDVLPQPQFQAWRNIGFNGLELDKSWAISDRMSTKWRLGWTGFKLESGDLQIFPQGFHGEFTQAGVLASPHYEEEKYYAGTELSFSGFINHEVLFGIEYAGIKQGKTWGQRNYDPNLLFTPPPQLGGPSAEVPYEQYAGEDGWIKSGLKRKISSIYLQDQYSATGSLTITAGLRFDNYDDVGSSLTPRLASVYHLSDEQILKYQYAKAFRPPTFFELYTQNNPIITGNPDIHAETMESHEVGYIYNNGINTGRATVFYAKLSDLIVIDPTSSQYTNKGGAVIKGIEMEFARQVIQTIKIDGMLSISDTHDEETGKDLAGVAHVLANLGMTYRPLADYFINSQYRHVGNRNRDPSDNRAELKGYDTFDFTGGIMNLGVRRLDLHIGIKNVFNNQIVYPSPLNTYVDDYPRPGRQWWLQVSYEL